MSKTYDQKARHAMKEIRAAFADVKHPEKVVFDLGNDDAADLVRDFGDKHWTGLGLRTLFENRAGIWSLTEDGYRFYLPAFLTASLSGDSTAEVGDVRDSVMASLAPASSSDEDRRRFQRRISLLTDAQRRAVRSFLEAMRVAEGGWKHDRAAAPDSFWFSPNER